ncbi:uncharacterized protein LOC143286602 [Babylonia areolata]|uniref:uncharacterized protein LOC143286602 n=1 Tax=Babylonia areolata TaxID=304850 RepID=UPI003FD5321D
MKLLQTTVMVGVEAALVLMAGMATVTAADQQATDQSSSSSPGGSMRCFGEQWRTTQVNRYVTVSTKSEGDDGLERGGGCHYGEVVSYMVYDFTKKRQAFFTSRSDDSAPVQHFVYYMLYQHRRMYVYNNQTGGCIFQPLDRPFFRRCVPASAHVEVPELTYGAGDDSITVSRASFNVSRRDGATLQISITTTEDNVPILETFLIVRETGIEAEVAEYTNVQIGSVSDSIFDLPASCIGAKLGTPLHYPSIGIDL